MQNGKNSEYCVSNLDKTVTNVVELLKSGGLTVATAESCTGGLLSELITSVPGASEVFELGLCTYSGKMKEKMLGVPRGLIDKYGVVSSRVASCMADGLKKISGADICISVTGVAGPGGGTEKTPVGTVYIGFDVCGQKFVKLPDLTDPEDMTRDSIRHRVAAFVFGTIEEKLIKAVRSDG